MTVVAFDTHAAVKQLIAAGFSDSQAETVASVVRAAQDVDLSNLATKDDLAVFATKADLAEAKADIFRVMLGQTLVIIGAVVALVKMIGH